MNRMNTIEDNQVVCLQSCSSCSSCQNSSSLFGSLMRFVTSLALLWLAAPSFGAEPKPVQLELDPKASGTVELKLDQVVKPREFKETDNVKLLEVESKLLTKFHGKPTSLRGGVVLPPSFAKEPNRKYPVVYSVPGFGG